MLKKIIAIFTILPILIFAKVNDYRKAFSLENKEMLEKKIDTYENETGNKFFLNTFEKNEGFKTISQEKTVIVNLIKDQNNSKIKIQIKISQDLNPEEKLEKMNDILNKLQEIINTNNEIEVAESLVEGVSEIVLAKEEIDELNPMSLKEKILLVVLLTLVLISFILIILKVKKRKRYFKK